MDAIPFARRPLLGLAAAFATGALLGQALPLAAAGPLVALSGLLLSAVLAAPGRSAGAALAAAALGLGAASRAVEHEAYARAPLRRFLASDAPAAPVLLLGSAAEDARRLDDRLLLVLDVERAASAGRVRALSGRARIAVSDPAQRLQIAQGERLRVWATLRLPRGFASPGAFDVEQDALRRGIHAHGNCKSLLLVERVARADPGPLAVVAAWRRAARAVIEAQLPAGDEQGLVRAMTLGDRDGVSLETAEAFRIAGTYHVLALSGAQVALLAGMTLALLRLLRVAPLPAAAALSAVVWVYALFVGADPPVLRAAVMATFLALGKALDLDANLENLLGLAAFALLAAAPSAVSDVSFQLSFAATLGILLLSPAFVRSLPRLPLAAHLALAASLAAQLALVPLLAAHFHRLAPTALLLNLVAVPLASGVLLSGFALLLAHLLLPIAQEPLADLAWALAHALLVSGEVVRAFPWLDVRAPDPAPVPCLVVLLGAALLHKGRAALGGVLALAGVVMVALGPGSRGDGRLRLAVLDVGQGDALVLISPSGRTLLVDAGPASGRFDLGEAVVGPYLWHLGARRVDALALTHADSDHTGGAAFVLESFGVGQVWEGPAFGKKRGGVTGTGAVGASRTSRLALRPGGRFGWDGVQIEVLGPPPGLGAAKGDNNGSLVLALRYRAVTFLLTGDVERAGEEALPERRAEVLKLAHHGSRTSSSEAFLRRTRPRLALLSVGYRSPFGHPHHEVLARIERTGARLARTDRDGTLTVATDGTRIVLQTERSRVE